MCALLFFFSCYRDHRDLHSFPTRRSSDLIFFHAQPADHAPCATRKVLPCGAAGFWPVQPTAAAATAAPAMKPRRFTRSEEHTSELQSLRHLVCRLLLEKKKKHHNTKVNGY